MATYLSQISRCLSYHAPICRPHRLLHGSCKQWKKICSKCVCWHPTPSQLIEMLPSLPTMIHIQLYSHRSSSVFTPHTNVDMLRKRISFSGTPSESSEVAEATAPNVVPVGIIMPESKDGKQLKIVIVPLDLANQDIESLRNTLEALNQLRMHASEIDVFTNSIIEDLNKDDAALSAKETPTAIEEEPAEEKRKISYFEGYVEGVDSGFSEDSANAVAIKATDTRKATGKASDSQNMGNTTNTADETSIQAAELRQLANEAVDMTAIAQADNAATCAAASPEADIAPMTPAPYKPSIPSAPNQTPASPNTKPGSPPQTLPQTMPLGDPKELQISATNANIAQADSEEMTRDDPHVDQISIEVPDALGQRLNDMAIASMHLSFEMDMTNVRDAILNGELAHKPEPTLGRDAMVFLETKVEADPENAPQNTVPLRFNALIKGMVQIDADKLDPSHLSDEQLPEYNDTVTSIAASICSTALQRGFASEAVEQQEQPQPADQLEQQQPLDQLEQQQPLDQQELQLQQNQQQPLQQQQQQQMPVSTDESKEIVAPMHAGGQIATNAGRKALERSQEMKRMKQQHSVPTMSAVAEPVIDDQAAVASPQLKDGCKHPIIKKKKKCPKKCPLLDDPCKDDKCKRPQPKTPEKKAESTTEITASAGKKDPCGKKGAGKGGKDDKKKDPCAKFKKGGDKGGDKKGGKDDKKGCGGKKDGKGGAGDKKDPCAKFKKGAKGGDKGGDKKKDPCAKKGAAGGKDKKKDPCAKKGGAGGKDKKDPCGKKGAAGGDKKKDPCAKKGGAGADKKKDPCAKKGGAGGKDKKDPCAVFKKNAKGGDKKKDPCKKGGDKKDAKGGKGGGKGDKKDPCAKFKKGSGGKGNGKDKKDPCKKKYSTYTSPVSKFYHPNGSHFYFTRNPKRFLSSLQLNGPKTVAKKSASEILLKLRPCFKTYTTRVRRSYLSRQAKLSNCSLSKQPNTSSITPAKFRVYSTLVRRHYDGMPSPAQMTAWGITSKSARNQIQRGYSKKSKKKKAADGKCNALQSKGGPRDRKHIKARTSLRTDCYDPYEEGCPVNRCSGVCDTVKVPRKKCDRGQKPPKPKMPKKPKKKLPAICMVGKKSKDKKGKERNKLLAAGQVFHNQMRMISTRRYMSLAQHSPITKEEPGEDDLSTMEVIRILAPYQISRERQPQPDVRPFDVLIDIGSVALTGSDIHVYENANKSMEGMTLGHDATGFVEKVGSCVKHLHVGDRVVVESALSCGICDYCKRGLYNICADLMYNGFLATHQTHPADLCHRLPDSTSLEEGTLTQTLAMGCQACFKAQVSPTSNILIIGSTPTAVAAALCARAIGARKVTIAGSMRSSLKMIDCDFGFKTIYFDSNALFGEVLEDVYSKFQEWPNCAINCAISPMTMNLAVMALQPCSACILTECESECASFNALDILMKNIRLIPSFRSANMYPTALQLIKSGRAPMHKFIARTFSWSMLEEAFKSAQHESNIGLRKIIVNNTEEINIGGLFKKKLKYHY
ncbi:uncharacterized protein Dmoj_GI22439, isoform C [Drosophila mojavensis]|uniref:Uncharacterized protein, isoform C n=1 Tax=Drosophila mojavensis TaxID=7230 RepID=B4KE35_DROMO|nr:uncharacterized protein Dmoj_GI22439, isoform C [Drosophila mojavensis]